MANCWSDSEVEAAVEDYFNMLHLELTGASYNKSEHRRTLMGNLNNRSDGSVELKHQNISAVLIEMGIPYIDGYKPRFNYQRSVLPGAISDFLSNHPELHAVFRKDSEAAPSVPPVEDILAALERPPKRPETKAPAVAEDGGVYIPAGVNYLEMEARNQSLGEAGEQFVINFERARLIHAGKEPLADKIEQISVTVGPSAGFDIRSFEVDGTDRFIEAKTTKYGKDTPFFLTPGELVFSNEHRARYFLYRVFRFRIDPRVYTLNGYLRKQCSIKPSAYLAKPI